VNDWRGLREDDWRPLLGTPAMRPELVDSLARYLSLLSRWGPAVDLVGRVTPQRLLDEHVNESLAGAAVLPTAGVVLDVGSGNGFPIVPLLLARPALEGVLLEPRERRWAFLKEVVRELGLRAIVRRERLEAYRGEQVGAVTIRALAVEAWGDVVAAHLREDGLVAWWTTPAAARAASPAGLEPVLHSPLPVPERGVIAVWRRCST
jgi:16S rRNA (guanine(527)-N(7))-methyltransferase RsmG